MSNTIKASKIINDPVHGFIEIPRGTILSLIDTPAFQRLRRIRQLGLSAMVYPGAVHTRFNHALGAMHLMRQALDVLRRKKVDISKKEYKAALIAILLHDVGHGPFSHALERVIIPGLHHEDMSLALMHDLNRRMQGKLSLAIEIFEGNYPRRFLHQLVSSQLDMDRMDYLIRDSFFTGVAEGVVGTDRIIKILNVYEDQLVCEDKGIYSIEKFVLARRLMYWQVYLHKAAIAAEFMMVNILRRARELHQAGVPVPMGDNLGFFFRHSVHAASLDDEVIGRYIRLDDTDIEYAVKEWQFHPDPALSELCRRLLSRKLLKIRLQNEPFDEAETDALRQRFARKAGITDQEAAYFVFTGQVSNQAYLETSQEPILIWFKDGTLKELSQATDIGNIHALSEPVVKWYRCVPEEVR
ncbi:MAG: HD domain-containing protein [Bacteroidia bacterium]|nr:HD domain-containing protein [Bacteroidia bacterium]